VADPGDRLLDGRSPAVTRIVTTTCLLCGSPSTATTMGSFVSSSRIFVTHAVQWMLGTVSVARSSFGSGPLSQL
jgi:hypothetical protein